MMEHDDLMGDCAIVALGGHGRGALNIASDVDLLFLFRGRVPPEDSPVARKVLHLLWDLDFDLGHATRTVDQAIEFAARDDVGQTAMIDARFLAGYEPLYHELSSRFRERFMGQGGRGFAQLKVEQLRERRKAHGGYAQVLEPNVKESTGGLRDVHTVQWIMKARHGSGAFEALVEHRVLSKRDFRLLEQAVDLIWRVRNQLHFTAGRKYDRLDFDLQPKVAEALGYRDDPSALGVEHFMRDYYLAAREIVRITDAVCHTLTSRVSATTQVADLVRRRVLPDGAIHVRGKILLPKRRKSFFRDDPRRLMSLFVDMQRCRALVSETASRAIYQELDLVDDGFRHDPAIARMFLGILREPRHLGDVLRRMHWVGLLAAYMPEFGRLTCLVQHDYYHAYTADEHSIITVEQMASLADPGNSSLVAQVYRRIERPGLLHLAGLLHDVGKSGGHGHSERGAEMSAAITERWGLPEEDRDLLAFLIAHHLELSQVSQRRDIEDLPMISSLAEKFSDATSLDMLYVLTWADMNATQSEPVSQWKSQLLDGLYSRLRETIEGRGHGPEYAMVKRLESPQKFRDMLAERIGPELADRHLAGMPRRYSLIHTVDEAEQHARRAEALGNGLVHVDVEVAGDHAKAVVYTRDRSYLLSDICGVLAVNDLNILYADAYTRTDGVIVDIFGVERENPDALRTPAFVDRLRETFLAVWTGEQDVADLIAQHRRRWARKKVRSAHSPPHVVIDNAISERCSVIDVFAVDRTGLLYDIARTMSMHGLDIHMARIGTDADRVADAFYVTTARGEKLTDDAKSEEVRAALLDAVRELWP
jgi:[protein-PII] uridylyltransferase